MSEIRARRATPEEVLAVARPFMPETAHVVADLEGTGVARRIRAQTVERDGEPLGALVVSERCRWRWYANPVIVDPSAAPVLARAIDASPAWEVWGPSRHVDPLLPHLRRTTRRTPNRDPFYVVDFAAAADLPMDPMCRRAGPDDLDDLVCLFAGYELNRLPTLPRLREFLQRQLTSGRPTVIASADRRIVGANLCQWRTPSVDVWADTTVLPDYRRQGVMTAIAIASLIASASDGRVVSGVQATTNPAGPDRLPMADSFVQLNTSDQWTTQPLVSPGWFPGHRRLRSAFERFEGRVARRPAEVLRRDGS